VNPSAVPDDVKTRVARTYDAASDHFDHPALSFWSLFGERSATRAALKPGECVLDVACGTGASAIPAAGAVGPDGFVLGIDLAAGLLQLARAKSRGMKNVEFRLGDFEAAQTPETSFDAVLCVFGIFFFPDMPAVLRRLHRSLRPGGRMVITTWGPDLFEPLNTAFWDAVRAERPELYKGFNAWDTLITPDLVRRVFEQAEVPVDAIVAESNTHPMAAGDEWALVLGTGYRGTIEQLAPESRERVRRACARVAGHALRTDVIYATARR
jgi:ubiquinone/menaquinone biosynthesis C-methylase UbiE